MSDRTADVRDHERDGESGYVMAMTALLLIPLLIFAAFAVDVGSWYVRAQQIQRAADAAALASVVWMPDEDAARIAAIEVAAINGFQDQPGDFDDPNAALPQVRVSRAGNQQIRVDIRAEGDLHFGSVIESFEPPRINRFSTAEYILPVPLGNPTSALGTGVDTGYGQVDNFWLTGSAECEFRGNGDFIGAAASNVACNGGNIGINHRPEGHTFVVDVPALPNGNAADSYVLQARMTCFMQTRGGLSIDPDGNPTGPNGSDQWYWWGFTESHADTRFRLYPPDNTPLDYQDNVANNLPVENTLTRPPDTTCGTAVNGWNGAGEAGALNFWRTLEADGGDPAPWVTIGDVSTAGRHVLQVKNVEPDRGVWNKYSLRVVPLASSGPTDVWACSRIGPSASATCPNIYAIDFVTVNTAGSMYSDGEIPTTAGGLNVELFLAEIEDIHAGKTIEITMFDPADGIEIVQVLDPDGNVVDLEWESIDVQEYGYTVAAGGPAWSQPYSTDYPLVTQRCGGEGCITQNENGEDDLSTTQYFFQDRTIRMYVDLPADYECEQIAGQVDNCWWKVRYIDSNSNATESTTWGVQLVGDPVRLIE